MIVVCVGPITRMRMISKFYLVIGNVIRSRCPRRYLVIRPTNQMVGDVMELVLDGGSWAVLGRLEDGLNM